MECTHAKILRICKIFFAVSIKLRNSNVCNNVFVGFALLLLPLFGFSFSIDSPVLLFLLLEAISGVEKSDNDMRSALANSFSAAIFAVFSSFSGSKNKCACALKYASDSAIDLSNNLIK